jgi:hypothetical protein
MKIHAVIVELRTLVSDERLAFTVEKIFKTYSLADSYRKDIEKRINDKLRLIPDNNYYVCSHIKEIGIFEDWDISKFNNYVYDFYLQNAIDAIKQDWIWE